MTAKSNTRDELRQIDQVGYESYRLLLDLIYNAGGTHKDHYKLKDQVDNYIVSLLGREQQSLIQRIREEIRHKMKVTTIQNLEPLENGQYIKVKNMEATLNQIEAEIKGEK